MKIMYKDRAILHSFYIHNCSISTRLYYKSGKISTTWVSRHRIDSRRNIKHRNITTKLKINGCALCGYDKCDAALEFHHVGEKSFSVNMHMIYSCKKTNQEIADEIAKCILLCANCHREVHHCG